MLLLELPKIDGTLKIENKHGFNKIQYHFTEIAGQDFIYCSPFLGDSSYTIFKL